MRCESWHKFRNFWDPMGPIDWVRFPWIYGVSGRIPRSDQLPHLKGSVTRGMSPVAVPMASLPSALARIYNDQVALRRPAIHNQFTDRSFRPVMATLPNNS